MHGFYKRRVKCAAKFIALPLLIVALAFCGCSEPTDEGFSGNGAIRGNAGEPVGEVTFIDVGEGDAIYAEFGDGENLLIDCGEKSKDNFEAISDTIKSYGETEIDYLVLTHADADHVGGAADIINEFTVKNAYIPLVLNKELFPAFAAATNALSASETNVKISAEYETVSGEGFFFTFLSPEPTGFYGGAYADFNSSLMPNERERNDISAVIYLDICGVRFLFTGDAGIAAENKILLNAQAGVYGKAANREVTLYETDFLKVAHHGANDSTSEEFLAAVRPKNAVISTGLNYYGHPSAETIAEIYAFSEGCNVYRTDVCGDIKVSVFFDGTYKVFTQAD